MHSIPSRGSARSNAAARPLGDARLRFLFLAAKIWRHAGSVGVSYSDHYAEQGLFRRLMDRLREITRDGPRFRPVRATALRESPDVHRNLCTGNPNIPIT